jgi:hypothetical protein
MFTGSNVCILTICVGCRLQRRESAYYVRHWRVYFVCYMYARPGLVVSTVEELMPLEATKVTLGDASITKTRGARGHTFAIYGKAHDWIYQEMQLPRKREASGRDSKLAKLQQIPDCTQYLTEYRICTSVHLLYWTCLSTGHPYEKYPARGRGISGGADAP